MSLFPAAAPGPLDGARTVCVFAHPDDESLAASLLLPRLAGVLVVTVTDGAPGEYAPPPFATPEAYRAARVAELAAALDLAGIAPDRRRRLGFKDGRVVAALAELVGVLGGCLEGCDQVITHAWEGGHPDHDAVALAVSRAAGQVAPRPTVWEAPLYRAGVPGGPPVLRQAFPPGDDRPVWEPWRDAAALHLKRRMVACHASQSGAIGGFNPAAARYAAGAMVAAYLALYRRLVGAAA